MAAIMAEVSFLFKMYMEGDWRDDSIVKALTALSEDLSLIPSTYMVAHSGL